MFIYNENTQLFIKKVRLIACDIFAGMHLEFKRSRLHHRGVMYPLSFVVNDSDQTLGFYDPLIYQIGINKCFMTILDDQLLENVLKHEIAHFLVHINHGINEQAHGTEFKKVFVDNKWDVNFSKSQINLNLVVKKNDNITGKIQKLLELAKSDNENEAALAAKKANDLIQKHNLHKVQLRNSNQKAIDMNDLEDTFVKRVASYKRRNIVHDCLYDILREFSVAPVFSTGRGGGYLEVIGSRESVESAHYIYDFTVNAMKKQWEQAKKSSNLKGIKAKNSYYKSFTKAFLAQLKDHKTQVVSSKELIHLNNLTNAHRLRVYPRVSSQSSQSSSLDKNAWMLGSQAGKNFKVNKGLGNQKSNKLLTY